MKIKSVFFDLDGTLLDTAKDLGGALNSTLIHFEKNPLPDDTIRPHVSNGATALVKLGFGSDISKEEHEKYRLALLDFYLDDIANHTITFPGIDDCLNFLSEKKIPWGIATNKPWIYTEALLSHFDFPSKPVATICPDHVENRKPAPDSLFLAAEYSNCEVNELLYIGDHLRDIECGKNAGAVTVAAAYGYIDAPNDAQAWQADYTTYSGEEVFSLLQKLI